MLLLLCFDFVVVVCVWVWMGVGFLLFGVNEPLLSLFCLYFVVDFSVYCSFFFVFCFCLFLFLPEQKPNNQTTRTKENNNCTKV